MNHSIVVAAFYQFAPLPDFAAMQAPLQAVCERHGIQGTLLLASEGVNGTIAGSRAGIDRVLAFLRSDARLARLEHKESTAETMPFYRMKVRLKKEIVTLGVSGVDPNKQVGRYVKAEDWNALIADPDVVLLDTRNQYEFEVGSFQGALNPGTATFREFPRYVREHIDPAKHKKVAMFCTGGIRCEKASSYLLAQGFEKVYHLQGGILKYLERVPAEQSLWRGECFVFDQRVAVGHGLTQGSYDLCHGCRQPISAADKTSPHYRPGICCPRCVDTQTPQQRASAEERQKQIKLAEQRHSLHIGARFKKSQ